MTESLVRQHTRKADPKRRQRWRFQVRVFAATLAAILVAPGVGASQDTNPDQGANVQLANTLNLLTESQAQQKRLLEELSRNIAEPKKNPWEATMLVATTLGPFLIALGGWIFAASQALEQQKRDDRLHGEQRGREDQIRIGQQGREDQIRIGQQQREDQIREAQQQREDQIQLDKEKQTRWLPLCKAAQDFKETLDKLTSRYKNPEHRWNIPADPKDEGVTRFYTWEDSGGGPPLPLEARDFHELYLLDKDTKPIRDFRELKEDPGARRKEDPDAVRRVRIRIHELNGATATLYRTAKYLGYAQRVRRELEHGRLIFLKQREMIDLLLKVREELNGTSEKHPGAGVTDDLQDLIGESVWGQDDSVISYYEFRERLLTETGREQFTELFRFYIHFHKKMGTEVEKTGKALSDVIDRLRDI
jgi:hypothetical protein